MARYICDNPTPKCKTRQSANTRTSITKLETRGSGTLVTYTHVRDLSNVHIWKVFYYFMFDGLCSCFFFVCISIVLTQLLTS